MRLVFLLVGLTLFVYLTLQLGVAEILSALGRVGWSFLAIMLLYGAFQVARAAALSQCLVRRGSLSFRDLLWIRLSGEAVQFLTLTGPFLAEPTKAWLLRRRGLATREAFAAILTEYLTYTFLSAALSILGLSYMARRFALGGALATAAWTIIGAMAVFLATAAVAITFRIYLLGRIVEGLAALPGLGRYIRIDIDQMHRMEDLLLLVFRDRPGQLLRIAAVDSLAHALLIVEVGWILASLRVAFPAIYPVLIEAATKFASLAFFYIPTQIGAAEGTYAVVFGALGLAPAAGFALAFIRRVRTLIVAGAGLVALSALSREAAAVSRRGDA